MENMKTLYYIETYNYFNQILIFETREEAEKWCEYATRWSSQKINTEIKETHMIYNKYSNQNFYSIFPQTEEV